MAVLLTYVVGYQQYESFTNFPNKVDKSTGVQCDQIGKLTGFYTHKDYPGKVRRVKFYDQENQRIFIFLTNSMELNSTEVALLYKNRWQVELFFKWIKQHFKDKVLLGKIRKCRTHPNVFCNHCLLLSSNYRA